MTEKESFEKELERLEKKLSEANEKAKEELEKAQEQAKKELEAEQEINREIQENQKLLESKEQVAVRNLAEIQAEYNLLTLTKQSQEQELEALKKTITELIVLSDKLEKEKKQIILQ
jgi:molecular chaperone GrpE (heat shock protein)